MKFFFQKKSFSPVPYLPENAVFWMILILLTIGSISSLYEKAVYGEKSSTEVSTEQIFKNAADQKRQLTIYCVPTDKPQAMLSVDAACESENNRTLTEILKKHNINVTFFMTGGWVDEYSEDVRCIVPVGDGLGNYSENHKHMK